MKKEFIVERNGRSFVLYAGLLDLAHERGLKTITTTLLQIPSEHNQHMAICQATVETEQGTFSGLGDASPENVSRMMLPHLIRMAETRAKARALRDAVNVGVTALEELGDLTEEPDHTPDLQPDSFADQFPPRTNGPSNAPPSASGPSGPLATPKQVATIERLARNAGKSIPTAGLTRAQASEIISSLYGEMEQVRTG